MPIDIDKFEIGNGYGAGSFDSIEKNYADRFEQPSGRCQVDRSSAFRS
ncbi:MAG: hypothetical protein ACYTBS_21870 [Planctomycetota bacterium]